MTRDKMLETLRRAWPLAPPNSEIKQMLGDAVAWLEDERNKITMDTATPIEGWLLE